MEWFIAAIALVVFIHVLIAIYLWSNFRRGHENTGRSMEFGVIVRFVIAPLTLVIILILAALWVPEPKDVVEWVIVIALVAYLVYLSLSAIHFGLGLMREKHG